MARDFKELRIAGEPYRRNLSAGERQLAVMLGKTLENKAIRERLSISVSTYQTQRKAMLNKLGVGSIHEAAILVDPKGNPLYKSRPLQDCTLESAISERIRSLTDTARLFLFFVCKYKGDDLKIARFSNIPVQHLPQCVDLMCERLGVPENGLIAVYQPFISVIAAGLDEAIATASLRLKPEEPFERFPFFHSRPRGLKNGL